jgi:hypothetical protein
MTTTIKRRIASTIALVTLPAGLLAGMSGTVAGLLIGLGLMGVGAVSARKAGWM